MKRILFALLAATLCLCAVAGSKPDPRKYDIYAAGSGTQGTYLVQVFVYSRSAKVADWQLKFAAVHGVLFRGFADPAGHATQRALAPSGALEDERADYFRPFFAAQGPYLRFAAVVSGSYDVVRLSKGGYKVGAIVQVLKDDLRRELEGAGVLRRLTDGF